MHTPRLGDTLIWSLFACILLVHAKPASLNRRQLPPEANGLNTILSPSGVQIRYKEPGKAGVCETTPGVKSYSGYIDLAPDAHTFFWFFEARHKPAEAPITLWLNGGPGSDSLIGLFQGEPLPLFSLTAQSELLPVYHQRPTLQFLKLLAPPDCRLAMNDIQEHLELMTSFRTRAV